jgi:hypothetical protein
VFVCASSAQLREVTRDLAYDVRAGFTCHFGSAADHEALVDETHRMLAMENGSTELYLAGKRRNQLLAEQLEIAERDNVALTDEQRSAISLEAFGHLSSSRVEWEPAPPKESLAAVADAITPDVLEPVVVAVPRR